MKERKVSLMNSIVPSQTIEHSKQRVLTTEQVATAYGTASSTLLRNFQRNKSKFTANKHYFLLENEELKAFVNDNLSCAKLVENFDGEQNVNMARSLYLWTEKGAWLLAKSLNTDQAWQACELLADDYYRKQEQLQQLQQENVQLRQAQTLLLPERVTDKQAVEVLGKLQTLVKAGDIGEELSYNRRDGLDFCLRKAQCFFEGKTLQSFNMDDEADEDGNLHPHEYPPDRE